MPLDSETIRIGRDRITRVFRYLRALNQHRNPVKRFIREQPWVLWLRDLPDVPEIAVARIRESSDSNSQGEDQSRDFILKVRRPRLTHPPNPPTLIHDWLESGWHEPTGEIRVLKSRNETDDQGTTRLVRFEENRDRPKELEEWIVRWRAWAEVERPRRKAMDIFERLYELRGHMDREAERVELVVGDGILKWPRADGNGIHHPLLLQRIQLEFDSDKPEFRLVETEHDVELYSAPFQTITDLDARMLSKSREDLEKGGYHPLGGRDTSAFLKRLVVTLSSKGRLVEFEEATVGPGEVNEPRIWRDPVVFLRSRTLGFSTAIDSILKDLQQDKELPKSLFRFVGIESTGSTNESLSARIVAEANLDEILFTKHANPEQVRIAESLEKHGCVLVQGPPGTGKTHTIANLIGHLLARRKTVLVTSHTAKALRVLRRQVVENIRPLCVSVLERDGDSRDQMKNSVEAIVERLSVSDGIQLETRAKKLSERRLEILRALETLRQDVSNARSMEYESIVVGGTAYNPSDAARKVNREKEDHRWIPGPVTLGASLPLSRNEISDLYRTNDNVRPEDENEIAGLYVAPEDIPAPAEFSELISEYSRLTMTNIQTRPDLWEGEPGSERLEEIEALAERIRRAFEVFSDSDNWRLAIMEAGCLGGAHREVWERLLLIIEEVRKRAATAQEYLLTYRPELCADMDLYRQDQIISEILQYLNGGRSIGRLVLLTRRSWKEFINKTKCVGGRPERIEHFKAFKERVSLEISRQELAARWDEQLCKSGAPSAKDLGEALENKCAQFVAPISLHLMWHEEK